MSKSLFTRRELLLLLSLAFIQFVHIVDFMIVMPLGPQLMRIFAISPAQFGLLVSCYNFAAGGAGLLSAFFIDRFDRKKSLLVFYSGFAIGTLSCALASNYEMLLVTRTITGIFGGVLSSLIMAIVGDKISPDKRATAMGIVTTSFSIASIAGVPISLWLAQMYNWHAPFVMLGGLSLVMLGLIVAVVPTMKDHIEHKRHEAAWKPVFAILKNPNQIAALVMMMFVILGGFAVIPFLSPSFVANVGLPETQLPFIYLTGGIISIISSPIVGRLADIYGQRKVFVWGCSLSIIGFAVMTNLTPMPLWLLLTFVAYFFTCMGARMIPAQALTVGTVLPQHRGAMMSIVSSVVNFSSSAGAALAGLIVVKADDGRLLNYPFVGIFAMAVTLFAIIISYRVRSVEKIHTGSTTPQAIPLKK